MNSANQNVIDFIEHVSTVPWSNYTAADYSIEQWHNACLIHLHTGAPISKGQCKLPVKTPNGALNKNGVQAAAGALAGARGGVHASPAQQASAARALRGLYTKLNLQPPPSLASHSNVTEFISHYGKKGMKWGVRTRRGPSDTRARRGTNRTTYSKHPKNLSTHELEQRIRRMETEKRYNQLNSRDVSRGEKMASQVLTQVGSTVAASVLTGAVLYGIKSGLAKKWGHKVAESIVKR